MNKMRSFLLVFAAAVLVISIIVFVCLYFNLLINSTNSYPTGIYKIDKNTNWQKGDLVLVCPPKNKQFKINYNNYLKRSNMCSTGTIGLLKKVIATTGDEVVVDDSLIKANGTTVPNGKIKKYDHHGKKLYPCYGEHIIAPSMIWIMSDYNEKSFDSRYFCEVPAANVIGKAKLLIEF